MTSKEFVKALNKRYSSRYIKFELASHPYTSYTMEVTAKYKHKGCVESVTKLVPFTDDLSYVYVRFLKSLHFQLSEKGEIKEAEYLYHIGK